MRINYDRNIYQAGVTLIELVIFILIMSIALTAITLLYVNTTRQSSDPLMRIKSVELAQNTLEEILLKAYDENTPLGGGCVETTTTLCTSGIAAASPDAASLLLDPEEGAATPANPEIRGSFDDVDDYNNLAYCGVSGVADPSCTNACIDMVDETGTSIKNKYVGFAVCIRVSFAGGTGTGEEINNFGTGTVVPLNDAKRIDVIVTDSVKSKISLTAYSLNY